MEDFQADTALVLRHCVIFLCAPGVSSGGPAGRGSSPAASFCLPLLSSAGRGITVPKMNFSIGVQLRLLETTPYVPNICLLGHPANKNLACKGKEREQLSLSLRGDAARHAASP